MKYLEWNTTDYRWVWRIYVDGVRTSAYVPFEEGVRPMGVSEDHYRSEVERMKKEDQLTF